MELKKIELNGNEYTLVCDSRSTRNGFAHDCTLFVNGLKEASGTCYYINRTWEWYRYQTVMICTVEKAISERKIHYIELYKYRNNIKRLCGNRKKTAEMIADGLPEVKGLTELRTKLCTEH